MCSTTSRSSQRIRSSFSICQSCRRRRTSGPTFWPIRSSRSGTASRRRGGSISRRPSVSRSRDKAFLRERESPEIEEQSAGAAGGDELRVLGADRTECPEFDQRAHHVFRDIRAVGPIADVFGQRLFFAIGAGCAKCYRRHPSRSPLGKSVRAG